MTGKRERSQQREGPKKRKKRKRSRQRMTEKWTDIGCFHKKQMENKKPVEATMRA